MSYGPGTSAGHGAEVVSGAGDYPPVMDTKFELAVVLSKVLAETKLGSRGSLREAFYLGLHISLWDVVTTILVLYRFPLLFVADDESGAAWMRRLAYLLRPYRGLAARHRLSVPR